MSLVPRGCLALLLVLLAGCTEEVCEEAYSKLQSCMATLNCNKLDPVDRDRCEKSRTAWAKYAGNESLYLTACSNDDKLRAEADKIVTCTLDPKSCTCP